MPTDEQLHIGIMSGTSLDGIDIALTAFAEPRQVRLLGALCIPLGDELRGRLLALCSPGNDELREAGILGQLWARSAANGVHQLLKLLGLRPEQITSIGSHGQTVRHHPELGFSLQLGAPALLAELTNIDVACDFRSRDLAAGGQGAPLVPAFHHWAFADPATPISLLNIGGFANLTLLRPGQPVTGFDCGPGNVLMDTWIHQHRNAVYDADGAWAASGRVCEPLLAEMLNDSFFSLSGPRSTGREHFNGAWLKRLLAQQHTQPTPADVQATLLELTARGISQSLRQEDMQTNPVYVCGGGVHNSQLLNRLRALLPEARLASSEALGVNPDWMEAMAFAWLAWRLDQRQTGSLAEVTGARGNRILGALYPA